MGIINRGVVFFGGTLANGLLFIVLSRVFLPLRALGREVAGTGPATDALNTLPTALQLVIGAFQVGLILYFIGGVGQERSAQRRMR